MTRDEFEWRVLTPAYIALSVLLVLLIHWRVL